MSNTTTTVRERCNARITPQGAAVFLGDIYDR